jgi:hypothetical protein
MSSTVSMNIAVLSARSTSGAAHGNRSSTIPNGSFEDILDRFETLQHAADTGRKTSPSIWLRPRNGAPLLRRGKVN